MEEIVNLFTQNLLLYFPVGRIISRVKEKFGLYFETRGFI
jgi:hypothetical protein